MDNQNTPTDQSEQREEKNTEETVVPVAKTEDILAEPKVSDAIKSASENGKWYIVHTYAGHENKVARSLKQRVESMGFEERIFDIIVPTRNTIKVSQGKKETVQEKIFPGYVIIKMILDDESWLLVRTTQGVTAFIGAGNKPTPISEKEVEAIQKFMQQEEPLYKAAFTVGEAIKITDGPFADFLGTIDAIDEARGKIKVLVSIFGRETPVELDFLQVKKL
ncbi:MAG: transcription termination/antitermination protein NusG [bacterium]|nr:transcription termination/antitermination protein NusG [bacterium]